MLGPGMLGPALLFVGGGAALYDKIATRPHPQGRERGCEDVKAAAEASADEDVTWGGIGTALEDDAVSV